MKKIIPESEHDKEVLVIGLGNRQATPDALGPYVADNLNVTRHIVKEYGKYAALEEMNCVVSAIVPGVMAQTEWKQRRYKGCGEGDQARSFNCN